MRRTPQECFQSLSYRYLAGMEIQRRDDFRSGETQRDGLQPHPLSAWKQDGVYEVKDIPSAPTGTTATGASPRYVNPNVEAANAKTDRERYYAQLREKAISNAEKYLTKANGNSRFKAIGTELSKMEFELAKAEMFEPEKLPALEEKKLALITERRNILKSLGIDEAQLTPQFHCPHCQDTGFMKNGSACSCYNPQK